MNLSRQMSNSPPLSPEPYISSPVFSEYDEPIIRTYKCCHCDVAFMVNINEMNCRIFRHAIYKDTLQQVNQHLPKIECDRLFQSGLVYGCCKPFQIREDDIVIPCGYI